MKNQRYPEGYAVVVHSRAEAYPLQGWFVRRQRPPSGTPPSKAGGRLPHEVADGEFFLEAQSGDLFLLVRCACVWWWCVCCAMSVRRSRTWVARRVGSGVCRA